MPDFNTADPLLFEGFSLHISGCLPETKKELDLQDVNYRNTNIRKFHSFELSTSPSVQLKPFHIPLHSSWGLFS